MPFKRLFHHFPKIPGRMMASFYVGKEKQLSEIRKHLEKFSGGSVNLKKRGDGLAVIELNQPEKKNAMSGKYVD